MSTEEMPVVQESPVVQPRCLIVRFGHMRTIGELAYDGETWPTCGVKVVIHTKRGTEMGEVLGVTGGPGPMNVTREQIQAYIEGSGGADYPYTREGRVLRIATADDHQQQLRIEHDKPRYLRVCEELIREMELPMKLVDGDLLLGGEMATFYFLSEHRVDFRALVKRLAAQFHTRIQMHQVGARDEARLVADYETCGRHCCCRQFLKILKPVSMGSAKMQKATLDPSKISGRCGRLKCCLRYEEATYEELRKRLPRPGNRVRVTDGVGVVEETMILTQLVKVRLEDGRAVAVRVEELLGRDLPEAAPPRQRGEGAGERDAQVREQRREQPVRTPPRPGPTPAPKRQAEVRPITPRVEEENELSTEREEVTPSAAAASPPGEATKGAGGGGQQPGIGMPGRRRRRRRGRGRGSADGAAGNKGPQGT